uniref:Uncharacterized protein n=1 Tax=Tanacetum cinerariifolium TaxID=118510 RepID=A0A6L2NKP9_TANCI|nr:hypothetical protein [Tanacetum cinerariifolium]
MVKIHTDKNVADLLTKAFDTGDVGDHSLYPENEVVMVPGLVHDLHQRNFHIHDLDVAHALTYLAVFYQMREKVKKRVWEKMTTECEGFKQIVIFLNVNPIKYVLTVNPIVYTLCIEQFLATVKAKTINEEGQLQAVVDGQKLIITESTIKRDLQLEDSEGVDCLSNDVIFEHLTLIGNPRRNVTEVPQPSDPTSVVDEAINEEMDDEFRKGCHYCY